MLICITVLLQQAEISDNHDNGSIKSQNIPRGLLENNALQYIWKTQSAKKKMKRKHRKQALIAHKKLVMKSGALLQSAIPAILVIPVIEYFNFDLDE